MGGQIFSQNKIKAFAELYHHTQNQYYRSLLVTFEDKKLKIDGLIIKQEKKRVNSTLFKSICIKKNK